jgi:hypothetical protein
VQVAFLKECCRSAKDKVDMAGDVTIFEVLPAAVQEYGVLPTKKPAVAKYHPIAVHTNGQGLAHWSSRILECDVLRNEVVRVDNG